MSSRHQKTLVFLVGFISTTLSKVQNDTNRSTNFLRDKVNMFSYMNFVKLENKSLDVTPVSTGVVWRAEECAFVCANSSNGLSFNFVLVADKYGRHACDILSSDMFNATGKLVEKPGVLHYTINVSSAQQLQSKH